MVGPEPSASTKMDPRFATWSGCRLAGTRVEISAPLDSLSFVNRSDAGMFLLRCWQYGASARRCAGFEARLAPTRSAPRAARPGQVHRPRAQAAGPRAQPQ